MVCESLTAKNFRCCATFLQAFLCVFLEIIDKPVEACILACMTKTAEKKRPGRPRGPMKQHIGVMIPCDLWEAVQLHSRETGKTLSFLAEEGLRILLTGKGKNAEKND